MFKNFLLMFVLLVFAATRVNEDGEEVFSKILMNPERSNKHPFVGLAFKLEQGNKLIRQFPIG
jgi:hypothetical protein